MKRPTTLPVSEFRRMIDAMCARADDELSSTKARMDALRTDEAPPG